MQDKVIVSEAAIEAFNLSPLWLRIKGLLALDDIYKKETKEIANE